MPTLDRTGQRIGDEHHVGIARVLLLVAAEPTHADHGDAHGQWAAALGLDPAQGDPGRAGDGRRGEVRQRLRDDVDRQQAEDVAGGDANELRGGGPRAASTAWTVIVAPVAASDRLQGPPALAAGVPPR